MFSRLGREQRQRGASAGGGRSTQTLAAGCAAHHCSETDGCGCREGAGVTLTRAACVLGHGAARRGFNLKARHVIHTVGPIYESPSESVPLLHSAYT